MSEPTRHTISLHVANRPGVLFRVAGLFSRRAYNIQSLAVGPTEDPAFSRMTIVVAIHKPIEQLIRQVQKLVPVVKVMELRAHERVERELMLVKIKPPQKEYAELKAMVESYGARIVEIQSGSLMLEATGTGERLDALEEALRQYGIQELCRTGSIALPRGEVTATGSESPAKT